MDLNAASIFVRVASTLNFAAAARSLGVPRSTVSRKVAELEDALGVRLLERSPRAVRLTDAGRRFEASVSKAIGDMESAWAEVNGLASAANGDLRVSVYGLFARRHLPDLVRSFARAHPDVRLVVAVQEHEPSLVEDNFDARLSMGRAREKGLESVRLCTTTPIAVASPAYLSSHPPLRHPRELGQHDCLGMTGDPGRVTWSFREGTASSPVSIRPRLAVADVMLLASLAEDGLGVCQLPEFLAAPAVTAGRLVEVLREFRPPDVDLFLVHQAGPHVRPALRAFVLHLQAYFARRPDAQPARAPQAG